jgi:hypothetical protein
MTIRASADETRDVLGCLTMQKHRLGNIMSVHVNRSRMIDKTAINGNKRGSRDGEI